MDNAFWAKIHGGSTHFPIGLLIGSVIFDALAFAFAARRPELRHAAFYTLLLAALGAVPAVVSGLILSGWQFWGTGLLQKHHLYLWPATILLIGLAAWRLRRAGRASERALGAYLATAALGSVLMGAAGYWGGEMLLGGGQASPSSSAQGGTPDAAHLAAAAGRPLYVQSCVSCHGSAGQGGIGPSLRRTDKSAAQISNLVKKGVPPAMPAFPQYTPAQDAQIAAYVKTL